MSCICCVPNIYSRLMIPVPLTTTIACFHHAHSAAHLGGDPYSSTPPSTIDSRSHIWRSSRRARGCFEHAQAYRSPKFSISAILWWGLIARGVVGPLIDRQEMALENRWQGNRCMPKEKAEGAAKSEMPIQPDNADADVHLISLLETHCHVQVQQGSVPS